MLPLVWILEHDDLDPRPSALCQARAWAVPDAGGVLCKKALDEPCVQALGPATDGRKTPGTLQTGGISELEPTADPGALHRALSHLLLGKAASPSSLPMLFFTWLL